MQIKSTSVLDWTSVSFREVVDLINREIDPCRFILLFRCRDNFFHFFSVGQFQNKTTWARIKERSLTRKDKVRKRAQEGQAVIEYILIFGFISLVTFGMVKGFGLVMGQSAKSLAYVLTQQLSVGVCQDYCYFSGYKNQAD